MALALSLSGCGSGTGPDDEVTLKFVAADYGSESAGNSSRKYWDALAESFEAKHPGIEVDVEVLSWEVVDGEVAKMVEAGEAPDIAQIGAYADFAKQDVLYSADELLSLATQADFLPALTDAGEYKRVQYGMPFVASTRLLFYNKDLFAQAGLTAPKTWDGLRTAARALREQGVAYPFALPLGPEEAQAETMMWLLSGGGGYTDQAGNYAIDSARNVATFEWMRKNLVGEGLVGPVDPARLNRQKAFDAFTAGDVGMLNGHPTLMKQAAAKGVKLGMVPMPGRTGRASSTMGVADWMMAFKQGGHREQVGKFLDFVFTEKNVLDFAERYGLLPVTVSASGSMREDTGQKDMWSFLDALPTSELPPVDKTSWARVSADIKKNIGKAVSGNGDPAGVLAGIARNASTTEASE
ncbi:ABC transporter substrate-binding protein [Streptomyces sp. GC420]|uniref:ABC transporter substrate-binding protein n=1 Tax=Streptomyces sp. GC420 TaxID=2697568 RepID=UPI001414E6B6|nr:sugar ABC transporter substrate-binding protein [Streptomyces sp. GC420]NBM16740.1 extracellular solute-binding protein [Streptomyces sp. GC420]